MRAVYHINCSNVAGSRKEGRVNRIALSGFKGDIRLWARRRGS